MVKHRHITDWIVHLRIALVFLTQLPVSFPARHDAPLSAHVAGFPIAGAIIGGFCGALVMAGQSLGAPEFISASAAVLCGILITRALHEDGLADTIDGFGGGWTPARRLEIMRDSHIGTYGIIALIFSIQIRIFCLTAILLSPFHPAWAAGLALVAVHTLSRSSIVCLMYILPSARQDGRAREAGQPTRQDTLLAAAAGLVIGLPLLVAGFGVSAALTAVIFAAAGFWLLKSVSKRLINGQTGDVLGACQQISEIMLLVGLCLNL